MTTILENLRIVLYILLATICLFLYQAWQREHVETPPAAAQTANTQRVAPLTGNVNAPTVAAPASAATETKSSEVKPAQPLLPQPGQMVSVKTNLLNVKIDTRGGNIVEVTLPGYPEALGSKEPFVLMTNDPKSRYIAESGLLGKAGPDTTEEQALYTVDHLNYAMEPGQDTLAVTLRWQKNGINVLKTFTFTRGSYEIKVGYALENQSSQPWQGNLYTQLLRTDVPPVAVEPVDNDKSWLATYRKYVGKFLSHFSMGNLSTYFGAAITTPDKPFKKITFSDMKKQNLNEQVHDGWAAMIQHYFVGAWIPPKEAVSNYYSQVTPAGLYTIGMIGQQLSAAPGTSIATEVKLYAGPAITDTLEKAAPGLKLTIDYGLFWFISALIFMAMQAIYTVVGNWGWSIVLVTVLIKLIFYPLSAKSYRSMSMLKKMQPKLTALKERYGDDRQKLTQATMELYKTEKINPMSGCFPILIQIPVFIALYWVLVESVQLRQAPFILWIQDLSHFDPYFILPILMGFSMYFQQRLNPPPPDPVQAKVMMAMPFIFTLLFAGFPAGLMLYWFVNNTLSFAQQWYVMRTVNKQ